MKMVRSLLLGTAAGLVAMTGAQAADLPVKAKPVQYVKICSLYGAGFYYIPGTDTCLKLGGFFRAEWLHNAAGSFAPYVNGADARFTRDTNSLRTRTRALITVDVRSQTEYGTLRGYTRFANQWTSADATPGGSQGINGLAGTPSNITYFDRAFIQLGGWTWGKTQSFFDFFNTGAYTLSTNLLYVDTGGSGTPVFAYTWQAGNGVSATLSAEDYTEQRMPVVNLAVAPVFVPGATNNSAHRGYTVPDFVGNIRVDQGWGSAQGMVALHDVAANYYAGAGIPVNTMAHPADVWGWAGGAGLTLNLPALAPRDTISGMFTYCSGAARYCSNPNGVLGSGAGFGIVNTTTIGAGWIDDAYFNGAVIGSALELSKAWSAVGAFEHNWNPALRTSVYGSYLNYKANSATINLGCAGLLLANGCSDFSAWQIGSRTLWNPVTNLDVGVDVMYTKVNGAFKGGPNLGTVVAGLPPFLVFGDAHVWSALFRVQRNFWP